MLETYETQAKGIRILPGQWRPHYPWEHIAWVSPPWPSQDYIWLDFPEAIFTNRGLVFLSHINPRVPAVYPDWPRVPWQAGENRLSFERTLPDGIAFGGSLEQATDTCIAMRLWLRNGAAEPLTGIVLQTCAFLRACREFADFTMENKYLHTPSGDWQPVPTVQAAPIEGARFALGWRGGDLVADRPIMATRSNQAERYVAMTWLDHTGSLIGNPRHPCMHADPRFPDLAPGKSAEIAGYLFFHEGPLDALRIPCLG